MKPLPFILLFVVALHLGASAADAIQITVVAEDTKGRPVKDVRFTALATGAVSAPTTAEGRTKVTLPVGLMSGEVTELKVRRLRDVQPDWVFIDPWDGRVKIPQPSDYCKVILARRSDRAALESGAGLRAMTASALAEISKQTMPQQPVTDEQRKRILDEQAKRFGLQSVEIDKAIRAWKERAQDPSDIGIAALYERNYLEAAEQLEKSLQIRTKQEGESQGKVAETAYFLGRAQYEQGQYARAAESYCTVLERRSDDPVTLNSYGGTLMAGGRYNEVEPLLKRSLEIREKALGKDHPEVATSLNNLALLYSAQGKYGEAEPLFKRSLEIREKALGKDHPEVATSLHTLAVLYHRSQDEYTEAEPLLKRSLEIREKALGKDHPDVATSLNTLAELYHAQGKYAEAELHYRRALSIVVEKLGNDHPNSRIIRSNLDDLEKVQRKISTD